MIVARTLPAIALAMAIAVPALPARAEPAPPATLRELVDTTQALMDAIADGKAGVWKDILADDASIIDEFGRAQTKAEAVDGIHGFPPGFSGHIKLLNASARVWGDTAVLVCDADEYETVFGQDFHVLYRFTTTFVRRGHDWKLVAMQDVTIPTRPPTLAVDNLRLDDYPGVYRYGPDRAYTIVSDGKSLSYTTRAGRPAIAMMPVARDVFMDDGEEKNLLVFHRNGSGKVDSVIERRKFNDLVMRRDSQPQR